MALFTDVEKKPVVFVRLTSPYLNLWEEIFLGKNRWISPEDGEKLLEAFCHRILPADKIIISSERRGLILDKMTKILPQVVFWPWETETKQMEALLKEFEHLAYLPGIYPLLDLASSYTLYQMHYEYLADFSYIENMPPGSYVYFYSYMLLKNETFQEIKEDFPKEASLSEYIKKNLNQFHVEIHWEEPDLRLLRLDFSCATTRSMVKTVKFLDLIDKNEPLMPQLEHYFKKNPSLLFFWPSYIELEIYSGCEYKCLFCPRQYSEQKTYKMNLQNLNKILEFCEKGAQDTTICLGGMGEPLEHEEALSFCEQILQKDSVKELIVETNGYYLEKILKLLDIPEVKKLKIIVNLSSLKNYAHLHGASTEKKEKVLQNLKIWNQKIKEKDLTHYKITWMQVLKITDNEDEVDELYHFCEQEGMNFLFQKYNRYIDLMPERRVSDMTPLERFFCWHLRRDLFIRANGEVAFCKQDVLNKASRGNLNEKDLESIWISQKNDWEKNYLGVLSKIPNCEACDEYFTFNA